MEERICPNCGESCEKEFETFFVRGQEFCVCCNSNIIPYHETEEEVFSGDFSENSNGNNNVFMDFFNESGLIKST